MVETRMVSLEHKVERLENFCRTLAVNTSLAAMVYAAKIGLFDEPPKAPESELWERLEKVMRT